MIRNAPFLADGTPMPTRYWLVGADANRRVSTLESAGGVRRAEAEVSADAVAAAHARYGAERDTAIPFDHSGPRPSGGVGGTRTGVKCLHAHYAWYLAGGDDPVGAWVHARLTEPLVTLTVASRSTHAAVALDSMDLAVGIDTIAEQLGAADPPLPEDLTNAVGLMIDHLDDLIRAHPLALGLRVAIDGPLMATVAAVDAGHDVASPYSLSRAAAEDVFRTVATEASPARRLNPGLPPDRVAAIVPACCVVVAVIRALSLDQAELVW